MNEEAQADWLEERNAFEEARDLRNQPWLIGENYYFRLATYAWCGTVVRVGLTEIVLKPAAYIFDSGRFADAMRDGLESQEPSEIEPVGEAIIGRGALVDSVPYRHKVPTRQK